MMKGLELLHLCKRMSAIPLSRGIHTDSVLLARGRRGVPRRLPDEPGIRHRRALFQDEDITEEMDNEHDLSEEVDIMNIDKAYDLNQSEKARSKRRVEYVITAKKFFAPRTQPQMLTCNERHCIRYLHKQDPVQWNIKALSEGFPATPDTIKKIINAKWKITPERAKVIDAVVQKNWDLLAEGKLDADPNVLEHLKKFINRREVLLEQIKNADFYLPEVKKERVWNKGEFSGVLQRYERAVQKLVKETEMQSEPRMLEDGMEKNEREEEKSSLDSVHAKINSAASRLSLENKDSFLFGEVTKFYSQHTTLENLEDKILKRASTRKGLDTIDKAILETKLRPKSEYNLENSTEREPPPPRRIRENVKQGVEVENRHFYESHRHDQFVTSRNKKFDEMGEEPVFRTEFVPPDERTLTAGETDVGKLLESLRNPPQPEVETERETERETEEKVEKKIDFSDPERLRREDIYYDNEVKDIENTAFWNNGRRSREKALAEQEKRPHDGPEWAEKGVNPASTVYLSQDRYPEWIKIPKKKQKSGVTYKVKDCYYDADGEFLYRVPGMSK